MEQVNWKHVSSIMSKQPSNKQTWNENKFYHGFCFKMLLWFYIHFLKVDSVVRAPSAGGTQGPPVLRAPPPGAGNKGRLLTSREEQDQLGRGELHSTPRATQTLHCSLHQSRYSNTALFSSPVPLLKHSSVLYTSPTTQTQHCSLHQSRYSNTDWCEPESELKIKSTDNFKTKFHFFLGLVFVNGGKLTSKWTAQYNLNCMQMKTENQNTTSI